VDSSVPVDTGVSTDTGATTDTGSSTKPGRDAGSSGAKDAARPEKDAAEHDAHAEGGAAADKGSGCSCKVGPQAAPASAPFAWGALGVFGLAAIRRSRRRR
jgi:MYXO-CTERM domain-containing protein